MGVGRRSPPTHAERLGEIFPARAFIHAETCRIAPLALVPSPPARVGRGSEGLRGASGQSFGTLPSRYFSVSSRQVMPPPKKSESLCPTRKSS